ncbi:MAG: hypothetical protein WCP86_08740, partial [bacterium]
MDKTLTDSHRRHLGLAASLLLQGAGVTTSVCHTTKIYEGSIYIGELMRGCFDMRMRQLVYCCLVCFFTALHAAEADDYGEWKFQKENNRRIKICVKSDKCRCTVSKDKIPAGDGSEELGCTSIMISGGNPSVGSVLPGGFFRIFAEIPTPSLWTPQGLRYIRGGYGINRVSSEKTAGGVPQNVSMINPQGLEVIFRFANNESIGVPWGSTKDEDTTRLLMVDAEGWATTSNPGYYDLYTGAGDRYRFVAATNSTTYLQAVSYRSVGGRTESTDDWDSDVVWDQDGILRQVRTPTALADITVANDHNYSIRFYRRSDIQAGKDTNGYYVIVTGAVALTTWTIDNPEPAALTKLRVSKASGTKTNISNYVYTDANKGWALTTGGGLRTETNDELWSDDEQYMISTRITKGPGDVVVSKETQKYHAYPWMPELIEDVIDPAGQAMKTEYDYYSNASETNRYTRPKCERYPDGNWVYWDYDSTGRKRVEIRPWKDSVFSSDTSSAHAVHYDFA